MWWVKMYKHDIVLYLILGVVVGLEQVADL